MKCKDEDPVEYDGFHGDDLKSLSHTRTVNASFDHSILQDANRELAQWTEDATISL